MRRLLAALLVPMFAFGIASCGAEDDDREVIYVDRDDDDFDDDDD